MRALVVAVVRYLIEGLFSGLDPRYALEYLMNEDKTDMVYLSLLPYMNL